MTLESRHDSRVARPASEHRTTTYRPLRPGIPARP